ncbi:MAG: hypothetical protein WD042_11800 [Phycisphaeraceae bacterium]
MKSGFCRLAGVLALWIGSCLVGCAATQQEQVLEMPSKEVAELTADDVVRVMLFAGFSHEQILELGTAVRNALAATGGASIHVDGRTEALLSVDSRRLYVSSRRRGSFIYPLDDPTPPDPPPAPTTQPAPE